MKKSIVFIYLVFALCIKAFTQGRESNWVFGDSAGISFTTGQPVPFVTSINTGECAASVSDLQGNLLFYNGSTGGFGLGPNYYNTMVWDRNHQLMPNGSLLEGASTTTQGCIIIPDPGDTSKYTIFNLGYKLVNGVGQHHLFYSVVDMNLNGGNGDVTQKNLLICDSALTEKMCAVKHANGRDWWVITHKYGSRDFYKYILSTNNLITGPFIQSIGDSIYFDAGQLIFNEEGTKLAFAGLARQINLFDFDRCSGLLSNPLILSDPPDTNFIPPFYYGCSFSPSSSVLYVSTFDTLWQYDLNATNVKASKTYINSFIDSLTGTTFIIGQHLLAPDRKIYISLIDFGLSECDSLNTHLSVINNPNSLGVSCNFLPFNFALPSCNGLYLSLPNMPNYNLGSVVGSVCDTVTTLHELWNYSNIITVYPNPSSSECTLTETSFKNATLTLYDVTGRQVLQQAFKTQTTLDISTLSKGVYIAELRDNEGRSLKGKLVKE